MIYTIQSGGALSISKASGDENWQWESNGNLKRILCALCLMESGRFANHWGNWSLDEVAVIKDFSLCVMCRCHSLNKCCGSIFAFFKWQTARISLTYCVMQFSKSSATGHCLRTDASDTLFSPAKMFCFTHDNNTVLALFYKIFDFDFRLDIAAFSKFRYGGVLNRLFMLAV